MRDVAGKSKIPLEWGTAVSKTRALPALGRNSYCTALLLGDCASAGESEEQEMRRAVPESVPPIPSVRKVPGQHLLFHKTSMLCILH